MEKAELLFSMYKFWNSQQLAQGSNLRRSKKAGHKQMQIKSAQGNTPEWLQANTTYVLPASTGNQGAQRRVLAP